MDKDNLSHRAIPIEQLVSIKPFIVKRRVAFRDCDPAGIVYTPRFLEPISTSSSELFIAELFGPFGQRDEPLLGLGFPAKAVNMVFHSPAKVGDILDIEMYVSKIGNTTYEVTAQASNEGRAVFDCRLTMICVKSKSFTAVPLPEYVIEKLSDYLKASSVDP